MNIAVLVKPVPYKSIIDKDGNVVREKVKNIINKDDKHAIEEALKIKENLGGKITSISMSIKSNLPVIKDILSFGIDETILLNDPSFAGSDTNATSYILSKSIEKLENIDLIICGKSSSDSSTSQVGIGVAAKLNVSFIYDVIEINEITKEKIICKTITDTGYSVVEVKLPAVIIVNEKINIPRIPTIQNRLQSATKEIKTYDASDIEADLNKCGIKGSTTTVVKTTPIITAKNPIFIEGTIDEKVSKVVKLIKEYSKKEYFPDTFKTIEETFKDEQWVYDDSTNHDLTYELLAKSHSMGKELEAIPVVITFDKDSNLDKFIKHGASKVIRLEINRCDYLSKTLALKKLLENKSPKTLVFGKTYENKILSGYLAATLNLGLSADCVQLEIDDDGKVIQVRSAYGGTMLAKIKTKNDYTQMATILPNKFNKIYNEQATGTIETIKLDLENNDIKILEEKDSTNYNQFNKETIISFGMVSIKQLDSLKQLSSLLNASLGTTRDVVDRGYLESGYLIGQSGTITKSHLFLTFGVSGALEHTTGINSDIVISVNNDEKAQIFKESDYCVVEDVNIFLPLLIEKLKEEYK